MTDKKALLEWDNVSHVALWKDVFWIIIIYLFVMSIRLCVLQSTAYLLKTESIRWREAMLISGRGSSLIQLQTITTGFVLLSEL